MSITSKTTILLAMAAVIGLSAAGMLAARPGCFPDSDRTVSAGPVRIGDGATACGEGLRVHSAEKGLDVVHTRLQRAETEVECGHGLEGWISGRGREVLALCLPVEGSGDGEPFVYVRTQPEHPAVDSTGRVGADPFPSLPVETNGKTNNWYFGRAVLDRVLIFEQEDDIEASRRLPHTGEEPEEVAGLRASRVEEVSEEEFEAPLEEAPRCAGVATKVELRENATLPHLIGVLGEGGLVRIEGEVALIR